VWLSGAFVAAVLVATDPASRVARPGEAGDQMAGLLDITEPDLNEPLLQPGSNLNHAHNGQTTPVHLKCANSIACENLLPGASPREWSTAGPGDSSILGFATEQSVNVGSTVRFKINTTAKSYHIDIFRIGWYRGNGARKIASALRPLTAPPHAQPACLIDKSNTTGLIDCGNWSESASWAVPNSAVSGVYFARLVRDDNGGSSYIFFRVRDDASRSDIVYQTSDTTDAAYNLCGGNSLYRCKVACPPVAPTGNNGAFKVSFNRPVITTSPVAGSSKKIFSFFYAEYQLVQFLEANGYDVTYISGVDTDRFGPMLKHHRVFISSGHDEYWSGLQRANVESARDAGVNLAFFSGNEVFWKTRYENSIDGSHTPYRTLVTYKETQWNAVRDPLDPPIWTGTWRDARFSPPADGGRPQNALTGMLYSVNGPSNFPIQVPAADGKMRFWRNTTIAALPSNQTATLAPNTIGSEWDEDVDNGVRPAGLFHLSTTTEPVDKHLVDYSITQVPGVATHHLALYRAHSRALILGPARCSGLGASKAVPTARVRSTFACNKPP